MPLTAGAEYGYPAAVLVVLKGFGWIGHVLGTNMKFDPDEFNFFKQRRDEGTTEAFRSRERRFGV